ncbi:ATP phosphoribosyltransferase regulatory subunit [Abyssogena phaseoliformis symbiont OG214]|uniref:ATP phosphoribosyltransferase regulatory subunit n=1 Tax=Abyssogena phaseoliformis symbiont TaxID=596095 RepID=UPI001916362C|nr:ATP phosphoribosyltransferase regulatory subunit [Abyssogena phaseoliformis symbiont]MBW5289264.1 ATP phosphoribosyltransferase regulatory subunit [Candidatus Ruthia sp. Apha_13_S6]BBB22710.1 ATP phosphoribosyltransferase regulatory subunit [Abyssogena phaseoliformis symbiont OG214]
MGAWQLPEGIDELTNDQALVFESLRRQLLDLYADKGFGLVIPPMVEHVNSLLLTSDAIDEKTFKLLDPISGKMLGVHADITPQIARIDAKRDSDSVEKYCYINSILKTKADDFYASRSPIQAGAELYGSNEINADVEVIELMLESLKLLSISPIVLSLSNVAIFDALITQEDISIQTIIQLRAIFSRRSTPDLAVFLNNNALKNTDLFTRLIKLEGGADILSEALTIFSYLDQAKVAIEDLIIIDKQLNAKGIKAIFDLSELQVHEYHTGIVFSAYNENYSKALAQGGRYNGIGKSFGKSRAATGFSFDLKFLSQRHF